ncbi:uncharacterized protein [Scyliorhinus torazame]|uniref:uncharacterized protein n=1 Tax=Scyliorhinus torazame TaxID=75743 RepID=UPI003B5B0B60
MCAQSSTAGIVKLGGATGGWVAEPSVAALPIAEICTQQPQQSAVNNAGCKRPSKWPRTSFLKMWPHCACMPDHRRLHIFRHQKTSPSSNRFHWRTVYEGQRDPKPFLPFLSAANKVRENGGSHRSAGVGPKDWPVGKNGSRKKGLQNTALLYSLYTQDWVARFNSNLIYKFADDTTVVGRISNNDKSDYRREINHLVAWCTENNLSLNIEKTKELIIDFRKRSTTHTPVCINGSEVEMVDSFRFLGITITNSLSWSTHVDATVRKAQQRLYFLRKVKKFGMSTSTFTNFYRCAIESILSGCIATWYGNCSVQDRKELQSVVNSAQCITQACHPRIDSVYTSRCLRKADSIIRDPSHPGIAFFQTLPSGRRYRSLKTRTSRHRNSFFPTATRFLNNSPSD